MTLHFQREVDKLKKMILAEAAVVEDGLRKALKALREGDLSLAKQVYDSDSEIDRMEIDVEEEALKILALHQPVAQDLRFIIAVIKINNDLERIGDLMANMAKRVDVFVAKPDIRIPEKIYKMARLSESMVRDALSALVDMDEKLSAEVCSADEQVDTLHKEMFAYVQQEIKKQPQHTGVLLHQIGLSRNLERIADHATNIAEDVIYMVSGKISRHKNL